MKNYLLLAILLAYYSALAQPAPTAADKLIQGLAQKEELIRSSIVKGLPFRNIGPTVMSGRVVDLAVNPDNPVEFFVAYASGGVWFTDNNGASFRPVLDNSPTQNVGCIAVDWENNRIWVGTGEVNASRSSYAGIGLLRSDDAGETWKNVGLHDGHHISKILLNPDDPNEVLVAVAGHLYSTGSERGVYRTTDGGKTWERTLFVNNQTGIIDMDRNPQNYNEIYASAWDKDRKAWNFRGNGNGSGIYKSADGGINWKLISTDQSGFPTGEGVGRIGLAVADENVVYAIHDNQFRRPETAQKITDGLTRDDFRTMDSADFLALDNKKLESFLRENGFQEKYQAENVKNMVRSGNVKPVDLTRYLEDANSMLFDTPVIGAEVYRSEDGGNTWQKTHEGYLDGLYYSYGYYFGKIHVSYTFPQHIYIYGVPILKSEDGGKTFRSIGGENVHADHHALWINPNRLGHLINGNDGGVNITYDDGRTWIKNNAPAVGQFYTVNIDNEKPYNVYGGLQDNGVWKGPHNAVIDNSWHQSGQNPYESIMGGDGMQVQIDNRDINTVYTGFQFGNYFRLDLANEKTTYIQPKHELGDDPYRFNWQTPILLSPHNQDILYLGGNKLMRSMDKGDSWRAISPDLTKGGKKGNVAYGTLTSISESPFEFGLLYAGSDDGLLHVSRNAGGSWRNISGSFPADLWVSRVIASGHAQGRVYVTLNGYRWDDFTPYVYMSEDYGDTWSSIASNLPPSPVNVIKEDPVNDNILYLGTDNGAWMSFDQGGSWQPFAEGLPNVAIHDLVIQEREKDLILGTHGRSLYLAEIGLIQQLRANESRLVLDELPAIRRSPRWGRRFNSWSDPYQPKLDVPLFAPMTGDSDWTLGLEDGTILKNWSAELDKGVNIKQYDLTLDENGVKALKKNKGKELEAAEDGNFYLPTGTYTLRVKQGDQSDSLSFEIK